MSETATAAVLDTRLRAWRRLAQDRVENAPKRTLFCIAAGMIASLLFQSSFALVWCGVVGAAYLVDVKVWSWAQTRVSAGPTRGLELWVFVQALVACGLGPVLWFEGGNPGKVVAAYFLAAGVFNALATFKTDVRLLAVALSAPTAVLIAMPILDYFASPASVREMTVLIPLLGALVLAFFCMSIWRGLSAHEETWIAEQFEALAQKARADKEMDAREQLLGMVERELRAPLQALRAATRKLVLLPVGDGVRPYVRTAHDAGEVLNLIVGDLAALSSLQAGGLRTEPTRTNPRALAESLAEAWRGQAQDKWLELFVDVTPATPEAVALDATRVSQVLHHLLGNAVRYTRQGGVRLRVDAAPGQGDNGLWLAFSVSDTGPGIAPDRLTEMLRAGDRVAQAAGRGFGLATAVSACVAEAMGGRLSGSSVVGQGAAFSLVVPTRALAPGEEPGDAAGVARPEPKPLAILVVDDHAATRRLASIFLAETAAKVTTASSGEHALAAMAQERFDVVLTDLMMPGMDGYGLAAAIRAQGERGAAMPIVGFSADSGAWDTARAAAVGLDGFVAKPFTPSSLFQEISKVMALRPAA